SDVFPVDRSAHGIAPPCKRQTRRRALRRRGLARRKRAAHALVRTMHGQDHMKDPGVGRRDFLKSAVAGGAAAASAVAPALPQAVAAAAPTPAPAAAGYEFLNIEEAAFVEALVDHMVPAD